MKPTQEQIDYEVAQCRAMEARFPLRTAIDQTAYIVALADRVAELQRDRVKMLELLQRWNAVEDMDDEGPALLDVTEMLVARLAAADGAPKDGTP